MMMPVNSNKVQGVMAPGSEEHKVQAHARGDADAQ